MRPRTSSRWPTLACGCCSPEGPAQEERARLLALLRTFEETGIGPETSPAVAFALVKVVELEVLLRGIVARIQHGGDAMAYVPVVEPLLAIGADKRQRLLGALGEAARGRVMAALACRITRGDDLPPETSSPLAVEDALIGGFSLPLTDTDARHLATVGWGSLLPWPWRPLGTS